MDNLQKPKSDPELIAANVNCHTVNNPGDRVIVDDGKVVITQYAEATIDEIASWLTDPKMWK